MPRLQVYLPDELHRELKARDLPASELLQAAVRAEIRRLDLLTATDRYLAELLEEVGPSTAAETEAAAAFVASVQARGRKKAS